jgi:hypothetical protein
MGFFFGGFSDAYLREQAIKDEQKRQRVELEKSLRHQHWTSSQSLIEFKIWYTKSYKKLEKGVNYFLYIQYLKGKSGKRRWIIRIPIYLIMFPMNLVFALIGYFLFWLLVCIPVAIVKLTPTKIRYSLTYSNEVARFDKRIKDENTARENARKQEEIETQLRLEHEKAREEERLEKQLVVFWRREFENSSDEALLDVWAVLQQFPTDHYFYFMLENSPGPILRSIVDQEVSNRSISVEARQLALHRLERKTADASHYRHLDQLAYRAQRDAQERHSEVMDGLMSVAMRQLYR